MNRLGFVGLGIMGKGMLKNLVTKLGDSNFVVWNRSPEVIAEFQALYPGKIEAAVSAADVVKRSDITFCMLSTLDASVAVFDCEDGSSTFNPE